MYSRTLKSKIFIQWSILKEIYKRGLQVQDVIASDMGIKFPLLERDSSSSLIRRMISRWYFEIHLRLCNCYQQKLHVLIIFFIFLFSYELDFSVVHCMIRLYSPSQLNVVPLQDIAVCIIMVNRISLYM